jgi:Domain of unknown function (DUF397)
MERPCFARNVKSAFLHGFGGMVSGPASEPVWQRGQICESGACVEIASHDETVMVRSSTSPEAVVALSRDEWQGFRADLKAGFFDEI